MLLRALIVIPILVWSFWTGGWAGLLCATLVISVFGNLWIGPPTSKAQEYEPPALDDEEISARPGRRIDPTRPRR